LRETGRGRDATSKLKPLWRTLLDVIDYFNARVGSLEQPMNTRRGSDCRLPFCTPSPALPDWSYRFPYLSHLPCLAFSRLIASPNDAGGRSATASTL
jgi:hypothetical protein